jgi:protein SCO1/2
MEAFLAKHGAKPGWLFLTGTLQQSEAVQRAFDIYRGNRKSHPPAYFIRDAKSGNWWRIGGLPAAEVVVGEFRRLAGQGK